MKAEEILKLIDAGFTRDEILKLEEPEAAAAPEEPEEEEESADPGQVDPQEEFKTALNGILDSFKAVAKEIKAANIANSKMPEIASTSADDVMAQIAGFKQTK